MDEPIEILGHLPGLNIYTQMAVVFAVQDDSSFSKISDTLSNGLKKLAEALPWVAGQVVNEGATEDNTGVFKLNPYKESPPLIVKDLRDDPSAPKFDSLKEAGFPFHMLDESVIAPRPTLPIDPALASEPEPVFIVQATYIAGGLILTFLGQHQVLDGTGQGQLIALLAKACRGESFTEEEVRTGNLTRHDRIPLLDHDIPDADVTQWRITAAGAPLKESAKSHWALFNFPSASLAALKNYASESVPKGYVTTDDALSALVWQSVTRIRAPRLDPKETCRFARAVDVRSCLGVAPTFPGLIQSMANSERQLDALINAPLGEIASLLRSAVDPKTLAYETRALATALARTQDRRGWSFGGRMSFHRDVQLASWAKMDLYDLDYGSGLGLPESVRRPQFTTVESLAYLLPKDREGGVALAICLRDDDMDKLRADENFSKYGTYIGE